MTETLRNPPEKASEFIQGNWPQRLPKHLAEAAFFQGQSG
ncbi:hypothetical protein CLOLEP_03601 [[Clostridium] leptum DSM 753]|uniref:Uncharacterized protein n=1 Tax=[Clostridium] leptum DSM 753 TaxID=428125 RepID=A7VYC3_9FIRM|nr:hypothetical protein CLOLEP_03601 [[Clostridium] leptum DSM 753]